VKIVLDTNALVSGLLEAFGPPAEIVRLVISGDLPLLYDARILLEYKAVLLRPMFSFNPTDIHDLLAQIEASGAAVAAPSLAQHLPHQDDEPFWEVALAGKAQYLVTGNLKHFPVKKLQGMTVVLPAEFLKMYCHSRVFDFSYSK